MLNYVRQSEILGAHEETFMNASDNKGDEFENKANFSDCE